MNELKKRARKYIQSKPDRLISVPALLCFLTFITNLVAALQDGNIDGNELHQLLSTADGFETVVLLIIMVVLRGKKK